MANAATQESSRVSYKILAMTASPRRAEIAVPQSRKFHNSELPQEPISQREAELRITLCRYPVHLLLDDVHRAAWKYPVTRERCSLMVDAFANSPYSDTKRGPASPRTC